MAAEVDKTAMATMTTVERKTLIPLEQIRCRIAVPVWAGGTLKRGAGGRLGHRFTPPVYNRGGQHSPGNRGLLEVVLARSLLAAFTHEWLTFLPPSCSSLRGIAK